MDAKYKVDIKYLIWIPGFLLWCITIFNVPPETLKTTFYIGSIWNFSDKIYSTQYNPNNFVCQGRLYTDTDTKNVNWTHLFNKGTIHQGTWFSERGSTVKHVKDDIGEFHKVLQYLLHF